MNLKEQYKRIGGKQLDEYSDIQGFTLSEGKLNEGKRRQIQFAAIGHNIVKKTLKKLKPGKDYDFGVGRGGMVLLDIDVRYLDQLVGILNNKRIRWGVVESKLTEAKYNFSKMYPNSTDLERDIIAWYRSLKKDVGEKYAKEMRADLVKVLMKEGKLNEALKKDGHTYNVEEIGATTGTNRGGIPLDKAYAGKDGMLGNHGTYISWSDVKRLMRKYSR